MERNETKTAETLDSMEEIVGLRGLNVRHYQKESRRIARISAIPQNYYDEQAKEFCEIDLTLREKDGSYFASCGKNTYEFQTTLAGELVRIGKDGVEFGWKYLPRNGGNLQITADASRKYLTAVKYENIDENIDLEYILSARGLKENIIIKEKLTSYRFDFELNAAGLNVELIERDGRNYLSFTKNDAEKFAIPEPFMYDAKGVRSEDVLFEVQKEKDGKMRFAVVAAEDWINSPERAFPIVIDPEVVTGNDWISADFAKCYSDSTSIMKQELHPIIGSITPGGLVPKAYMVFDHRIPAKSTITKAILSCHVSWNGTGTMIIGGNYLSSPIVSGGPIPQSYSTVCGFAAVYPNTEIEIDIKSIVQQWVTTENYGLQFFRTAGNQALMIYGESLSLDVEYIAAEGVENRETLAEYQIGSGKFEINLNNGNRTYSHKGISISEQPGMAIFPIYDDCLFKEPFYRLDHKATPHFDNLNTGWKLNLQQYIINGKRNSTFKNLGENIVMLDAYGLKHIFHPKFFYLKNGIRVFVAESQCKRDEKGELIRDLEGFFLFENSGIEYQVSKVYHDEEKHEISVNESASKFMDRFLKNVKLGDEYYYTINGEEFKMDVGNYKRILVDGKDCYGLELRYADKDEQGYYMYLKNGKTTLNNFKLGNQLTDCGNGLWKFILLHAYYSETAEADMALDNRHSYAYKKLEYEPCYESDLKRVMSEEMIQTEQQFVQMIELLNKYQSQLAMCWENEISYTHVGSIDDAGMFVRQLNCKNRYVYELKKDVIPEKIMEIEEKKSKLERNISDFILKLREQPIDFLKLDENKKLGFNYYGVPVQILDGKNELNIHYYDCGIALSDSGDGSFVYSKTIFKDIADQDGRVAALFEYSGSKFVRIMNGEGKMLKFGYTPMFTIYDPQDFKRDAPLLADTKASYIICHNYGISTMKLQLMDNKGKKLVSEIGENDCHTITIDSLIDNISHDNFESLSVPTTMEKYSVQLHPAKASVEDSHGNKMNYTFDERSRPRAQYLTETKSNERRKLIDVVSFDNETIQDGIRRKTRVQIDESMPNLLDNGDFERGTVGWSGDISETLDGFEGKGVKVNLNTDYSMNPNRVYLTDWLSKEQNVLVFSGWVKMDSVCIGDETHPNAKFELQAVVKFRDNSTKKYSVDLDCLNRDWQFAAVPLIVERGKEVVSVQPGLCIDNNNAVAYVDNFRLAYEKGYYEEYNSNDQLIKSSDFHSTIYYYDYVNGKSTRMVRMDEDGCELEIRNHFDPQGRLICTEDSLGNISETIYDEDGKAKKMRYHRDDPTLRYVTESAEDKQSLILSGFGQDGKENCKAINIDGEMNSVRHGYTFGLLTQLDDVSGTKWNYTYDARGNVKRISLNDSVTPYAEFDTQEHVSNTTLGISDGMVKTATYGSEVFKTAADRNKSVMTYKNDTTEEKVLFEQTFDACGRVVREKDKTDTIDTIHTYLFDQHGRQTSHICSGARGDEMTHTYSQGRVTKTELKVGAGEVQTYRYEYLPKVDHKLSKVEFPNGVAKKLSYDLLKRRAENEYKNGSNEIFREKYQYLANGKKGDRATNLVSSVRYGILGNMTEQTRYGYDNAGNINSVTENGVLTASYEYDELNRLTRENSVPFDQTTIYQYDAAGNILTKKVYAFTLDKDLSARTPKDRPVYPNIYSGDWHDQLIYHGCYPTDADAVKIEYDAIGNPTIYRGQNLEWSRGRLLTKYGSHNFSYDALGFRKQKDSMQFHYFEGKLMSSISSFDTLYFIYDESGICGVKRENTSGSQKITNNYIFRKNIFGDVTHIYNTDGALQASYVYDAWGNHKIYNEAGLDITKDESYNNSIGKLNPIRYRGYFYDSDIDLYYLNSRYYDPKTGRFINADDLSILSESSKYINGLNLYSFCFNNPVMNVDSNGYSVIGILLGFLLTVVLSGSVTGLSSAITAGLSGENLVSAFAGGFVNGAMVGLGIGIGIVTGGIGGFAIATAFGFGGGFFGSMVQQGLTSYHAIGNFDYDINQAIANGVISAMFTMATYGLTSGFFSSIGKELSGNFLQRLGQYFAISTGEDLAELFYTTFFIGGAMALEEIIARMIAYFVTGGKNGEKEAAKN